MMICLMCLEKVTGDIQIILFHFHDLVNQLDLDTQWRGINQASLILLKISLKQQHWFYFLFLFKMKYNV